MTVNMWLAPYDNFNAVLCTMKPKRDVNIGYLARGDDPFTKLLQYAALESVFGISMGASDKAVECMVSIEVVKPKRERGA